MSEKTTEKSKAKKSTENKRSASRAKFLVFVDESEHTETTVRFACKKARIKNRPVEMLFVINPGDYNSLLGVSDVMKHDRKKEVELLLKTLAEKAADYTGITPSIIIREGDAEEEIVKIIEGDEDINMLLISSHPSSSVGGTKLLANIAEKLDEKLHIPMMIIPAHLNNEQIVALN